MPLGYRADHGGSGSNQLQTVTLPQRLLPTTGDSATAGRASTAASWRASWVWGPIGDCICKRVHDECESEMRRQERVGAGCEPRGMHVVCRVDGGSGSDKLLDHSRAAILRRAEERSASALRQSILALSDASLPPCAQSHPETRAAPHLVHPPQLCPRARVAPPGRGHTQRQTTAASAHSAADSRRMRGADRVDYETRWIKTQNALEQCSGWPVDTHPRSHEYP